MKERDRIKLADADFVGFGTAAKTRGKRSGWKKLARRAAAGLLAMSIVMTTALADMSVTAWAEEGDTTAAPAPEETTQGAGNGDTRVADAPTWDDWKSVLNIEESSENSGRVWTDKSVFGENAKDKTGIEVGDNEFVEVFSAMGSSQEYEGDIPVKMVFVIDNSGSMYGNSKTWEDTRIAKVVKTINTSIDTLMRDNEYNEVAVVLFGDGSASGDSLTKTTDGKTTQTINGNDTAKVIIPMGRYAYDEDPTKIRDYLKATWKKNDELADGETLYQTTDTTIDSGSGYVIVNHEALGETGASVDYTAYRNGTTNIQAGIYVGMRQLLDTNAEKVINGVNVEYNPSLVVLTDGASTDTIALGSGGYDSWFDLDANVEGIENQGFVNDPGRKDRSITAYATKYKKDKDGKVTKDIDTEVANMWNMFIEKSNDQDYVWEVIGGANAPGTSSPQRNENNINERLNQLADDYSYTVENMLLGTLVTAGYMKAKVNQKYGERRNCHIYTISLDMDDVTVSNYQSRTDSPGIYSTAMMNPNECFNTEWIDGHNKIFTGDDKDLISTVVGIDANKGTIGYQAVQGMKNAVRDWNEGSMSAGNYMAWIEYKSVWKTKNESIKYFTNTGKGENKTLSKLDDASPTHDNFYKVERTSISEMSFERSDVDYDVNYVDQAYYVKSNAEAGNTVGDIFEEIVQKEISQAFNPVSPLGDDDGEDGYLIFTDPIGTYMKVNSVEKLNLFGKDFELEKTSDNGNTEVYQIKAGQEWPVDCASTTENDKTTVKNPCYTMDKTHPVTFDPSQISVIVETNSGTPAEGASETIPLQTLTVKIPGTALPIAVAHIENSILENKTEYTTNIDDPAATYVSPLRVYYTIGMIDEVMTNGEVDPAKISPAYAEENKDDEGYIQFYTNQYTENTSGRGDAGTEFVPGDGNRYYLTQPDPNKSPADPNRQVFDRWYKNNNGVPEENRTIDGTYDENNRYNGWLDGEKEVPKKSEESGEAGEAKPNRTGTAGNAYVPGMGNSGKAKEKVQAYLGNNGLLRVKPAELLLTKAVSNDANNQDKFSFILKLTKNGKEYTTDIKASVGTYTEGEDITGTESIYSYFGTGDNVGYAIELQAGQGILFRNLPSGYTCTVTEILPEVSSDGTFYKFEDVTATGGFDGKLHIEKDLKRVEGVLRSGEDHRLVFHFTNKRYYKASLEGTKQVAVLTYKEDRTSETDVMTDATVPSVFRFKITADSNNPSPDPVIAVEGNEHAGEGYRIVENSGNKIEFYKDAEFEWDQVYTYTISEEDNPDLGYQKDKATYTVTINLKGPDANTSIVKSGDADDETDESGGETGPSIPSEGITFTNTKLPGTGVTLNGFKKLVSVDEDGTVIEGADPETFTEGEFQVEITGVSKTKIERSRDDDPSEADMDEPDAMDLLEEEEDDGLATDSDQLTDEDGDENNDHGTSESDEDVSGEASGSDEPVGKPEGTTENQPESGDNTEFEDEGMTTSGIETDGETGESIARASGSGIRVNTALAMGSGIRANAALLMSSRILTNIVRSSSNEPRANVDPTTESETEGESNESQSGSEADKEPEETCEAQPKAELDEETEGSGETQAESEPDEETRESGETQAESEPDEETRESGETQAESEPDEETRESSEAQTESEPDEENGRGGENLTQSKPDNESGEDIDAEATPSNALNGSGSGKNNRKRSLRSYSQGEIRKLANEASANLVDVDTWPESSADGVPLPDPCIEDITENGSFAFEGIEFEEPGIYTYAVREVKPNDAKDWITYDGEIYTIVVVVERVSVAEQGDGTEEDGEDDYDLDYELKVTDVTVKDSKGSDAGSFERRAGNIILRGSAEPAFTNTIYKPKVSAKVTKVWVGDYEDELHTRPENITVQLLRAEKSKDGTAPDPVGQKESYSPYGEAVLLPENNKWEHTWENLEQYKDHDRSIEYVYYVAEVSVDGYETSITSGEPVKTDEDGTYCYQYTITNTYTNEKTPKLKIHIIKTWLDHGGADSVRDLTITLKQWRSEAESTSEAEAKAEAKAVWVYHLNKDTASKYYPFTYGNDTWEFDCWSYPNSESEEGTKVYEFEKYWKDESGEPQPYYYTAEETVNWPESGDNAYKEEPVKLTKGTLEDGTLQYVFSFENSYDPKVDIVVKKVWQDDKGLEGSVRPDSIQVQLYRSVGGSAETRVAVGGPETLSGSTWSCEWNDLPEYPDDPDSTTPYIYSVEEVAVPEGYASSGPVSIEPVHKVGENDRYELTITNTYTEERVNLKVTKVWANDEGWESLRPDEIEVQLLQDGKPYSGSVPSAGEGSEGAGESAGSGTDSSKQTIKPQSDGTWSSAEWNNLPKWNYTKQGGVVTRREYVYSVKELTYSNSSYYDTTYSEVVWDSASNTGTVTITNTLRTALIRVAKWVDNAKDHVADAPDIMNDEFIVEVDGKDYKFHTGLRLQHAAAGQSDTTLDDSKYSGYLKVPVSSDGTTLYIKETAVPKEYKPGEVYYTYANGIYPNGVALERDEKGRYLIEITADMATVNPETGQIPEIVVVVHNTFEHDHYFHNDASVDNDFGSQEKKTDIPTGGASKTMIPTASLPPASSEDRRVKVATLDIDERLV